MKKSVVARVGVVAAALTLATTSMMSGTLARYTTEKSSTAKAVVAMWNPSIKVKQYEMTENIKLLDYLDANIDIDKDGVGTASSDGDDGKRVAPGMSGTIPLVIDMSESEVDTKYTVKIVVPADSEGASLFENPDTLEVECEGKTIALNATEQSLATGYLPSAKKAKANGNAATKKTVDVAWSWPLDPKDSEGSSLDAQDGNYIMGLGNSKTEMGFKIIVELTQATGLGDDKWTPTPEPSPAS